MKDSTGREWNLAINVAAMRRAKTAGVNLSHAVEQIKEFVTDDVFLCDALWAVVQPQAKELAITQEQFEAAIGNGDVLEKARIELFESLCEYYPDPKASMLQAALKMLAAEMAKVQETISSGLTESKAS